MKWTALLIEIVGGLWMALIMYAIAKSYVDPYLRAMRDALVDWWHQPAPFPRVGQLGRDVNEAVSRANA